MQGLLHRPVRERKEDGLVGGIVHHGLPAWYDEDVPGLPVDDEVGADASPASPFDGDEDRGVGRPVWRGLKALREELDERRDRRQRIAAGHGIAVAHLE